MRHQVSEWVRQETHGSSQTMTTIKQLLATVTATPIEPKKPTRSLKNSLFGKKKKGEGAVLPMVPKTEVRPRSSTHAGLCASY